MNAPDDLQKLWQGEGLKEEDPRMWKALIQEKRTAWDELVTAADQTWYLLALCFIPLTVWAAWKAKYPWVHVGYGLMAATLVLYTLATWMASRRRPQQGDRNLREHLEALMESYDRRSRFIRRNDRWAVGGAIVGTAAVVLGIPGHASSTKSWMFALLLVAGAIAAERVANKRAVEKISRKREEAAQLLKRLLAGGPDQR